MTALAFGASAAHSQPRRRASNDERSPRTSTHFHEVPPPTVEVVGNRLIVARRDHVSSAEARARAAYYRDWVARHASAMQASPMSGRWSR